ncbi:MAG: tRNA uridine-5-carboxymethylaminomethyl(34) synthesis enzyme MnmG [Chthoniobacteraceae bacterium]
MFVYPKIFDVIVVGAGHAGIEASMAAARLGCQTVMLTQNIDTIGQMSCNPAVGGLAKGHMVREIDALGGFMGLNTDATAIQCRLLNGNKGPSVRAPRSQCDKKAYQFRAKAMCERQENLIIHQGNAVRILEENGKAVGIETNLGLQIRGLSVIITTGTFMRGLLHVGLQNQAGGRMGDSVSTLSDSLKALGFEVARFKTGTPCRLNGRSIDFSVCDRQDGDVPPPMFTYMPELLASTKDDIFSLNSYQDGAFHVEQMPCWITHTNEKTHDIIRANLDKSPMYSGKIEGVGPRYCPSIEDKVVKFAEKGQHQLFLEPEGRHTEEYYVNGISTSLPFEVQYEFIRSIRGLENAEIMRPGYAVEYDYCTPTQLFPTLETKKIEHLYFAGQINGTSGYEEAAAQGMMAGINAALKIQQKPAMILGRDQAYVGVLIDDLVTKGTPEPYRMFTSRAEYRLLLRQDNADLRLTTIGQAHGVVSPERFAAVQRKIEALKAIRTLTDSTRLNNIQLTQWLKRPDESLDSLPAEVRGQFSAEIWDLYVTDLRYAGYIKRQEDSIEKARLSEGKELPVAIDYTTIPGLRIEAKQKLTKVRPVTYGQAGRISGITPADLALISVWLKK